VSRYRVEPCDDTDGRTWDVVRVGAGITGHEREVVAQCVKTRDKARSAAAQWALVDAIRWLPQYREWTPSFVGEPRDAVFVTYLHPDSPVTVDAVIDWDGVPAVSIGTYDRAEDRSAVEDCGVTPWPRRGRTWKSLWEIIRPELDRHQP